FHCTTLFEVKFEPPIVRVSRDVPATAEAGVRIDTVGRGRSIRKLTILDADPPGFTTVTCTAPASVSNPDGTDAVICVSVPEVVASGVVLHITTEPVTNPLPATVRVRAGEPATAEAGVRLPTVAAALAVTAKAISFEGAAPGLATVTDALP